MFRKFDNTIKIALINFFSSLYFYLPILTLYYQQRGLNFVQINSLWGVITGAIFLSEIPTGLIADKIGRKNSIIISLVLQITGEFLFLFAQNYFHFILVAMIAGIGFAFQSGCSQALLYDSLKEKGQENTMNKVTGFVGAFFQGGHILGALISSLIIAQLSAARITLAIILTIVSVSAALFISLFLEEPKSEYHHTEQNPLATLRQSFSLLRHNSILKRLVLFGLFTTPFIGYLRNLQPPYFHISYVPTYWLGLSLTLGGLVAIAASMYAHKLEKLLGAPRAAFVAAIIPAYLYIAMSVFDTPILAIVIFVLTFGLMSLQDPILAAYNNRFIPSNIRATTLSTINMFSSIYITLLGLFIGVIADYSVTYAFLFMGILILCAAFVFKISPSSQSY